MNLHHDKEAFAELIIGAANELAIPTNVIEKDYYVTITLKALAEKTKDMVFKGGTSLTKCYQLLDRFSEDIDLSYTAESGIRERVERNNSKIILFRLWRSSGSRLTILKQQEAEETIIATEQVTHPFKNRMVF